VSILRFIGYSTHLLPKDNGDLIYDVSSRCFENALQLQPENVGVLLAYGESVMEMIGGNYNLLRHAISLFKRCLASKDFPNCSKTVHHRIFHNLVTALGNPWNYYQNSMEAIQEFVSIADTLMNAPLGADSYSLYITLANGYSIVGRVDNSQRLFYFIKQNSLLEKAYELAVHEDKLMKKLRDSCDPETGKVLLTTLEKSAPPCCSKHSLSEILESWGVVQEQLAECYALSTNQTSFVQRGKWLLSAIKKYQDAILLEPTSWNLHFRVGCGYASWLRTKIESGSQEPLTTENVWLKNAEVSWQRALQVNLYSPDVYKHWVALYSYLGDRATDPTHKQRFIKLAQEKHELQTKLEMLSQQVMSVSDFFGVQDMGQMNSQ